MRVEGKPPSVEDIVTDHGALTGLSDDDHTQYHTDARGDARYWALSTDLATQAELDAHLNDTLDAHDASAVSVADAGNLFDGVNVETVLAEIFTNTGAAQSSLDAHIDDTSDAHDASAISVLDAGANLVATNVETALAELADYAETLTALVGTKAPEASTVLDGDAAGGALSGTYPNPGFAVDMATQAELDAAVASFGTASGISFTPGGTVAATNVQSAIAEVASEKVPLTRTITSGAAMTGGGALSGDLTLDVAVDGSTIEVSGDALRVKDDGITSAKIADGAIVNADVNAAAAIAYSKLNLSGSIQEADLAFSVITDDSLQDHIDNPISAHEASAIHILDVGGYFAGSTVEAILQEIGAVPPGTPDAVDIPISDAANDFTATNVEAALAELQSDAEADEAALAAHLADTSDAHDASAISILDAANDFTATDVEGALAEIQTDIETLLAGSPPSGSAGGALDGTYPNPGLASSVAGDGLAETSNVLSVNVDGTGIEISSDSLRLKDSGVVTAKLAAKGVTPAKLEKHEVEIQVTNPNGAALTVGDGKAYFLVPSRLNGLDLVGCYAGVTTVSSSGLPTVQIANVTQAADMLTTKLTIDASAFTSFTAATAVVIDTGNDDVATGDILRIDCDVAGTGAKGLIVGLIFG